MTLIIAFVVSLSCWFVQQVVSRDRRPTYAQQQFRNILALLAMLSTSVVLWIVLYHAVRG